MAYDLAIEQMIRNQLEARGIADRRVLDAMRAVPRHRFVTERPPAEAYADRALPTAQGQTISQPYIVARMTELLDVHPGHRVLEVGTGSGYQAAVLAALGARVTTVERHASLADSARRRLHDITPDAEVTVVVGDGTLGWPDDAPYDRILVTAGGPDLPPAYPDQLADDTPGGGRIVVPLGTRQEQALVVYHRRGKGAELIREDHDPCRFVPLLGEAGWAE